LAFALVCAATVSPHVRAQQPPPPPTQESKPPAQETKAGEPAIQEPAQLPPEEDGEVKGEQYSFNPVKSKRDVVVGLEYFKKGNFKAAADRFTTATKWNEGNADAWLRLGEAEEKRGNMKGARSAYQKFLELSPDAKIAPDVKKRLEKLHS
jgi:tetratricopeptide (TPR) repeat protein